MSDTDFPSTDALFDMTHKKSRAAVLEFGGVAAGMEALFRDELVADIGRAREHMMGGIGVLLKESSYFIHGNKCYVVLISRDALLYKKWQSVHFGVGSKSIAINSSGVSSAGRTSNSLHGVLQMFSAKTTGIELSKNLVRYNLDPVRFVSLVSLPVAPSLIPSCAGRDPQVRRTDAPPQGVPVSAGENPEAPRREPVVQAAEEPPGEPALLASSPAYAQAAGGPVFLASSPSYEQAAGGPVFLASSPSYEQAAGGPVFLPPSPSGGQAAGTR